ncbi:glycosyltransferase 87 family protein [Streptomyces sp. ME19-01-6]|uniref:glycosyltransferase 87 family protein n=1 Tax=Streptomyces sp. ME19-01-6 TaxID=3028686 RepID=UPI0029B34546|nr:glycosyltransferase 87 family protein [Streptomyces sp. ME19-01-6]MDX3226327.1 glycosyltransferase 87 family protein [Streptomyces sp. ME19-01-6]
MTVKPTITESRVRAVRAAFLRRPTLFAAAFCLLSFTGFWIAQRAAHVSMADLMVYRAEGWSVRNAMDLYDMRATVHNLPNTYPPFASLLFTPLTFLSTGLMRTLATAFNLALMVALVHLALRLIGRPRVVPRPAAALSLAAVGVWCEPVWTTLRYGQINLLVTVLVLWDLTRRAGRRGYRWAGVGTGIAASIKITPALFVVFLALAGLIEGVRRLRSEGRFRNEHLRRAAVATGAFVTTVALSGLALPHDSHRYWTEILFATDRPGDVEGAGNQNLRGVLARLLHTSDPGLWWLAAAALFACAGLATAVAAQLAEGRLPGNRAWAAVACGVTALMISPISWSHHWVWAVPMVLLLGAEALRRRTARWRWLTAVTALLFCSFMMWYVPHDLPQRVELHQNPGQMLLTAVYPIIGVVFLAVAGLLTIRALRTRRPHIPDGRAPRRTEPSYARG